MSRRRTCALVLSLLLLVLGGAGQAQAVGYRYWSFWDLTGGKWTYATQGPSTARPSDGDVQGFRFAVSADSQDASKPRGRADFASICAKTPARAGHKRVALVIDSGTTADAPGGETPPAPRTVCARVPADATTADALATVAKPLRYDTNALLCAIAGYPGTGCGEQVATSRTTPPTTAKADAEAKANAKANADAKSESARHGPSLGLLAGIAAVAALGGAAVWQTRRRRP
ncbi:SCO2322 family protein [Streptomyces olivochromogenes]|uniref:SCO2322 family protein n=1 Tax=Streptomyces olivochromogenes TaxID=1963 RepID=UPI00368D681E